eukprot:4643896-Alexandrium_andersonii.AAC.1
MCGVSGRLLLSWGAVTKRCSGRKKRIRGFDNVSPARSAALAECPRPGYISHVDLAGALLQPEAHCRRQ